MRPDIESITERINAFWSDHGHALIAAAGLLVLVLVAVSLIKIARSAQRDRWVAGVTALVVLAWTSEGLWEVARHTLKLPLGFAAMTFFVYEAMMLTSALQAEKHRKHHPTPGPAGRYVWLLASLTATIVALNAPTLVEALLRLSLPLAATGLWWLGITAERADDSAEVCRQRQELRQAREARRRRALATIGFLPPGALPPSETVHERRIRRMVAAGIRLHSAKPNSRRARRANRRLCRLAMLATDHDIAAVKGTVDRVIHVVELILPAGLSVSTGTANPSHSSDRSADDDGPSDDVAVLRNGRPLPALEPQHRPATQRRHPVSDANPESLLPRDQAADRLPPFPPADDVLVSNGQGSPPLAASGSLSGSRPRKAMAQADAKGEPGTASRDDAQWCVPTQTHSGEPSDRPQVSTASSRPPLRNGRAAGNRLTAARLYRDGLSAGKRLSVSALAEQAGCCRTTAWRAIRWSQSLDQPAASTRHGAAIAARAARPG